MVDFIESELIMTTRVSCHVPQLLTHGFVGLGWQKCCMEQSISDPNQIDIGMNLNLRVVRGNGRVLRLCEV